MKFNSYSFAVYNVLVVLNVFYILLCITQILFKNAIQTRLNIFEYFMTKKSFHRKVDIAVQKPLSKETYSYQSLQTRYENKIISYNFTSNRPNFFFVLIIFYNCCPIILSLVFLIYFQHLNFILKSMLNNIKVISKRSTYVYQSLNNIFLNYPMFQKNIWKNFQYLIFFGKLPNCSNQLS